MTKLILTGLCVMFAAGLAASSPAWANVVYTCTEPRAVAHCINNSEVVGGDAFVYSGGTYTNLDMEAVAINSSDAPVGKGGDSGNRLYISGTYTKPLPPTLTYTYAEDINNRRFLLSEAVPEPATICLLGLGGLALLRKRRACYQF